MKYYEHNQTMGIYIGDVKLLLGDVYEEKDGVVKVNGKIIEKKKEPVIEIKEEVLAPKSVTKNTTIRNSRRK